MYHERTLEISWADEPRRRRRLAALAYIAVLGLTGCASGGATSGSGGTGSDQGAVSATGDIVATAQAAGTFKTLVAAVAAADLADALKGRGPFTVFAPTDDAFAKLPAGTVDNLLRPENKAQLQAILKYHVVPGRVTAGDVVKLTSAKTLQGSDVKISVTGGTVMINDSHVTKADVMASNGVIHVIDAVLMPPT